MIEDAVGFSLGAYRYRSGLCPIVKLIPNPRNARTHSRKQIKKLARSIEITFGSPIIVDEGFRILAGHARLEAAKALKLRHVPVQQIFGMSESRKRLYILADNRIAEDARWDNARLKPEFDELRVLFAEDGLEIEDTGFEIAEIDNINADLSDEQGEEPVDLSALDLPPTSQLGDFFTLGVHRLFVADARNPANFEGLMQGEKAAAAFLDAPYNISASEIGGRGRIRHSDFVMGAGEMTDTQFADFLSRTHKNVAIHVRDGALVYSCMDWRNIDTLMKVGKEVVGQAVAIVVWVKSNAGQGTFYRGQHEFVSVFKVGTERHRNNVQQGIFGRNRSNVWFYSAANAFRRGRLDDLAAHPTIKNTTMVADAIKDCTKPDDLVLDCFGGSGTTLAACERIGRRAALMELDPKYADVIITRWQKMTGKDAVQEGTGLTFDALGEARKGGEPAAFRVRVRART